MYQRMLVQMIVFPVDNACTFREGISIALTDIKIRTAKPTDKQYKLTDGSDLLSGDSAN